MILLFIPSSCAKSCSDDQAIATGKIHVNLIISLFQIIPELIRTYLHQSPNGIRRMIQQQLVRYAQVL